MSLSVLPCPRRRKACPRHFFKPVELQEALEYAIDLAKDSDAFSIPASVMALVKSLSTSVFPVGDPGKGDSLSLVLLALQLPPLWLPPIDSSEMISRSSLLQLRLERASFFPLPLPVMSQMK